ncbi:cobyric acid synthase [Fertoebacter nigrum]|uniref:Cobyric acid synthase n=1 Tax=Fertoeibacter niger TaxID=2656921 RepID=A0A8X8H3M8_9RHOB|nr:cobyric acid synthase [Fertoeibacter niger]NUB46675.1 cobyric acid synthase [Fertoeibacter niger]
MRAIMIQGAGSNVGKSLLVAGLCRAARLRGLSVAPFKPQNMSNNAAVTADGGEIGRAQALQALASGLDPHTDMNPVLLKPESEVGSQVIVQGRRVATVKARDYAALKPALMAPVLDSFHRLKAAHDLVIVEGAGSPAEVNLRSGDIANMGFARAGGVPVVLVGDIDRGGVIAQMVGTLAVLDPSDAAMIAGFIINKFRGDVRLFDDGYRLIADRTGWHGLGVVPYFADAAKLPAEDALDLPRGGGTGAFRIAVPVLSRIANFDDLDPLAQEPGVALTMLHAGQPIPGDTDLVILPGTKSTRADLAYLRAQGWDVDLAAHVRRGGHVLGICGGYQMLGCVVGDPQGIEGPAGETAGLGLLDVETVMSPDKRLSRVSAVHAATGQPMQGYEIHIGRSAGPDCARPFAHVAGQPEGAMSPGGRVMGSYLHGMFAGDAFRTAFLAALGAAPAGLAYGAGVEAVLDRLAAHLETHLDVPGLLALAR